MNKGTTKMIPGDELHLTMLMAPYSLNLVTGQDRQHLLAFGRDAFDAGKITGQATPCLHQIAAPAQAARTEFEAVSRFMKCEWNLDWDPAGFYDDAKTDAAFTWFEQGYMRAQQAAAPQAAAHPDDAAVDALAATQPAAQGMDAPNEWEEIHTLPTCDDLIWLYCQDTNTIDGPIAPDPSLEQYGWTHWAYANAPSTAGIDAAQAKQGGK